jgi:hypothetical protein
MLEQMEGDDNVERALFLGDRKRIGLGCRVHSHPSSVKAAKCESRIEPG